MVAFEEPTHRSRAVIPVVLVLLGANAAFGYGYLHYHGIAAEQETAIKRVESANADLQDALGHMRDRTQRSVQQLSLDNRELLTRLSAIEQRLSGVPPASPKPLPATESPPVRPAPPAVAEPLSPDAIQGALMGPSG